MDEAAAGFRVRSGRATAVLLRGSSAALEILDRRVVLLADPALPESRFPHHAGLEAGRAAGAKTVARLVKAVERYAGRALADLFDAYRAGGHRVRCAGVVVGGGGDPAAIANDHIRAHALEGRLFRRVIEEAALSFGVAPMVVIEKELLATASRRLALPEARLKREVGALGAQVGRPWRAEEKAAALAAWLALLGRGRGVRRRQLAARRRVRER